MRRLGNQSGQSIALFAIALLLVAVMTFFTAATGHRLQEKIKTQAAADSAAYGLAVSQARAMNVMALSNRAIIGEYVSALSVAGHISWMNIYEWTFDMQAELWQKLKADKNMMCGLYRYCHAAPNPPGSKTGRNDPACSAENPGGHDPVVCCKGPAGGCCTTSGVKCRRYNCYAAACTAPDALFDEVSADWHQGFGPRSYEGIHSAWHEYPRPAIKKLGQYAAEYVHEAWRASDQGRAAFAQYRDLLDHGSFAQGLAATVDPRMTQGKHVSDHRPAQMLGAQENLEKAVEIFPSTAGSGLIASRDFDVFNEVLTGTRGGGRNNWVHDPGIPAGMQWQPQHGAASGYFDQDAAALPAICQAHNPGPWPRFECSADWDEGDVAPSHYMNTVDWSKDDPDKFKGGEMMLNQGGLGYKHIHQVNTGNLHNYGSGDMGGRFGLSAEDHAKTTGNFSIDRISCAAYPAVDPGRSMVCLSETGRRIDNFGELAPHGHLECMRTNIRRGVGDTPNPAKGYNLDDVFNACASEGGETEVGFFRFAVRDHPTLDDASVNPKMAPINPRNSYAGSHRFNPAPAVNLFNQPFTYASTELDVTHDAQGNPLPWDVKVGRVGGSLLKLDQKTDEAGNARDTSHDRDGTDFTGGSRGLSTESYAHVRGFSAGLSYYHNPSSWKEVPNLFNPYWRATLAPPGANALSSLNAISKEDCEVGKELGMLNGADKGADNSCR